MTKVLEGEPDAQKIKVAIIPAETRKFRKLTDKEVEQYLKNV